MLSNIVVYREGIAVFIKMVPHIVVPALLTFLGIIDKKFVNSISVSQKMSSIMLIPLITKYTGIP